jgi:predicted transglutaminase-like cysteine proteinase
MAIFNRLGGLRAAILACGLVLSGSMGPAMAAPIVPFRASDLLMRSEPFGLSTALLSESELRDKWLGVERQLADEQLVLALCDEDRAHCKSPEALRFLGMIDEAKARNGRARLGDLNRALNLAIRPASDLSLYGAIDVWQTPLALLATGAGDCEDYAIAKFVALRAAGVPSEDLRIVILRDDMRREDHAVVSARLDGHWLLLDNRRMAMVEDVSLRNHEPLFVIDYDGVRQYTDSPLLASEHHRTTSPAELMRLALRVK